MGIKWDLFQLVRRANVVKYGIKRTIVNRAARLLDPDQQEFVTDPLAMQTFFERPPMALYAHFPFCASACSYCIFKKTLKTNLIDSYVDAVLKEVDRYADTPLCYGRKICSVHLGGGTPSLVPPQSIARILKRIESRFGFSNDVQITLEGNPESLEPKQVREYQNTGVDRFAMGVQSLDDDLLAKIGRTHTRQMVIDRIIGLQKVGVYNLSIDLMYGFEDQNFSSFKSAINTMVDLGVPHISAFPLITRSVRNATSSKARRRRDERCRRMYRVLVSTLDKRSYEQYSSEDFSCSKDVRSKYQLDAFRFPKRDVLALGAGSLGSLDGFFYANIPSIRRYIEWSSKNNLPIAKMVRISKADEMQRAVLLGAKYLHIRRDAFQEKYGISLEIGLGPMLTRLERLGIWRVDNDGIHVTDDGLQVVSEIWGELVLANIANAMKQVKRKAVAS